MKIDPCEFAAARGVFFEDSAQGSVAPRRRIAAEKEAVGMRVLAFGHGLLKSTQATGLIRIFRFF